MDLGDKKPAISAEPSWRAWYAVIILMCAYLMSMLDRTILALMVQPIQHDLHISDTEFSLLTGFAFVIFYSIAGMPIGWLVDFAPRRTIMAVGIALWSTMTVLCGAASSFAHLFAARVGIGIGEAALNPAAYSMLADTFPKHMLARAVALFSCGAWLGSGLAFLLGGTVLALLGNTAAVHLPFIGALRPWQFAFVLAGLPGLMLVALILTIREPARALNPGLVSLGQPPLASVTSFVREKRAALATLIGGLSFLFVTTYAFMSWMPALLIRHYAATSGTVGLTMGIAVGCFGLPGFFIGGALADYWQRQGRRDAHLRVGFVASCAALPCGVAAALAPNLMFCSVALCGTFVFLSMPGPAAGAGLQLLTPARLRGRISAIMMVIVNVVGLGLGPLAVAVLTDYVFGAPGAVNRSLAIVTLAFLPMAIACFGWGMGAYARATATTEASPAVVPPEEPRMLPGGAASSR